MSEWILLEYTFQQTKGLYDIWFTFEKCWMKTGVINIQVCCALNLSTAIRRVVLTALWTQFISRLELWLHISRKLLCNIKSVYHSMTIIQSMIVSLNEFLSILVHQSTLLMCNACFPAIILIHVNVNWGSKCTLSNCSTSK